MRYHGNIKLVKPYLKITLMKNAHLLFSSIVLLPIAITYGISPDIQIPFGISFSIESVDLKNILRAIMGLYLAMIAW
jgi:hypothetical protein